MDMGLRGDRSGSSFPVFALVLIVVVGAALGEWHAGATERHDEFKCTPTESAVQLEGLPEASGLALSRRTPGILWTFNDNGEPLVYALDVNGRRRGVVRVVGAEVKNWEAIASARCASGTCLYIADIGDNNAKRHEITVYRVPEPRPGDAETAPAERLVARYPDGPHDAEALFVSREGAIVIVTKEKPSQMYRMQPNASGSPIALEHAGGVPIDNVTDAATTPDGQWVAMRTNDEMIVFREDELALGSHGPPIGLRELQEPQGEGIAMTADGTVYLASEGKRKGPGSLRTMRCVPPKAE
jgi:hypothetical protein